MYMLFAGWQITCNKKTVTEVLKMLPEAGHRGQHFQDRGQRLLLYGQTKPA